MWALVMIQLAVLTRSDQSFGVVQAHLAQQMQMAQQQYLDRTASQR
jgi:hypothetical protein